MIKFKTPGDRVLFSMVNPIVMLIVLDAAIWAKKEHGVTLTITDTKSTLAKDRSLNRKSSSHRNGLACDIRTKNLDAFFVNDLVDYINENERWREYRYLSFSGVYRLAYWHNNGNGEHLHIAIHSKFKE